MKFKFNKRAFWCFILLFIIEIFIGAYMHDKIIRPYGGDVLVVILLYCLLQAFIDIKPCYLIIGVLVFAFAVEVAQYFDVAKLLHVDNNKLMSIIIGNSFSYFDLVAYIIGAVLCFPLSKWLIKSNN